MVHKKTQGENPSLLGTINSLMYSSVAFEHRNIAQGLS